MADQFTISEVCICEAAKVWKEDGEILATGIGLLPRIAVGLAKKTPQSRSHDDRWRGFFN